ncbi:uncharacterized mitochondrial protein AtMg00810-like [Benincasa hispida]|uniref:uncharacterized mitochondrial protein AtMg00810-like n=1 Tax=Benincasa hispida TaxID=102211 RepID=UPI00190194C6|nr:uncharacterized mitochondrial protein AtMg00810-like [Benincasa hispida]
MLLLVYVNDVILIGNTLNLINRVVIALGKKFSLKDFGSINFFLGIQVSQTDSGLLLTQSKYIDDLLHKLKLTSLKSSPTPFIVEWCFSVTRGIPMSDMFIYRSTIGVLQYLTNTRSDIAYIVNHLSQFLQQPTDIHWQGVKRVLQYLSGTKDMGLLIQPSDDFAIITFSNIDWASDINDRKSVAAYCVYLSNSLVSLSSKKQTTIARSSTKSEYRALAYTYIC